MRILTKAGVSPVILAFAPGEKLPCDVGGRPPSDRGLLLVARLSGSGAFHPLALREAPSVPETVNVGITRAVRYSDRLSRDARKAKEASNAKRLEGPRVVCDVFTLFAHDGIHIPVVRGKEVVLGDSHDRRIIVTKEWLASVLPKKKEVQ